MKNIFSIHPFTYIMILVSLITGYFKPLIVFMIIIMVHELGHILAAKLFKWKIDKVKVMPFGCITIFEELINRPLEEEFVIAISGPLFQLILFLLFKDITPYFNYYNYGLFLFNLMPIYPLDGYKIISVLFSLFIPYKIVLYITSIISFISLIFILDKSFICILIVILLIKGIIKYYKDIEIIYNKFLFERYIYNIHFNKYKKIKNINFMYRNYMHVFKYKNSYITEDEMLAKKFN